MHTTFGEWNVLGLALLIIILFIVMIGLLMLWGAMLM